MPSLVEVNPFPLAEPPSDPRHADAQGARREVNLLALAWRSRWLLLLMMIVGGGGGWAVLQRVTPRYTSMSRIYVERNSTRLLDEQMQAIQSVSYLYTQAELIRSGQALSKVAERDDIENLESLRGVENPVAFLRKHVEVSVGANDEIINVWTELPSAEDAAEIVRAVVETYIDQYSKSRKEDTTEALSTLQAERSTREEERKGQREALDEFRKQHPELAVQVSDGNVVTLRFAALSQELNNTEIELLQAKAMFNRVKKMYDSPTQRPYLLDMAGSELQAMRDQDLERQVKQMEQALVSERARWGEGHPRVKLLKDSLTEMKKELKAKQKAIIEGYVESIRQQYELLDHKRSELQAAYDRQFEAASRVSALVVQLTSLEDTLTRTEKICDILDDRIGELDLSKDYESMRVNVLETASVPIEPSYPEQNKFLGFGVFLGGLCGFGLAWLRDLLDHRLKSVDEVAEVLQLPVLGVLPHLGVSRERSNVGRLVAHSPRSPLAEAIRTLRTALHFGLSGHDARIIAVTSPSPGDGKSTVASNLAIAMAQADQRVLLIDADMRKPTQHTIFEASSEAGLSSVLTDRRPPAEAIVPSGVEGLDLMPCGPLPTNPVELLNNGFFGELLALLKEKYDKIIIDSPPVMPVADARVIAAISDSTLLVLRSERSARRLSVGARNELWRVRAMRLGVVVNGVPNRKTGTYGYGYGYGGYGDGPEAEKLPSGRRKKSRALPSPQPAPAAAAAGDEI